MSKRVLWLVYLEQVALAVPIFWLLTYLWCNYIREVGEEWHYGRQSVMITGLVLGVVLGLTWYLMRKIRSQREYSFVNALPVTKGQQISALAGVMLLLAMVLTVLGEILLCFFCESNVTLGEILLNIIVKTAAVFCVDSIAIWIFSHRVPGAGGILLWISGLGIGAGMTDYLCRMFQRIFGMPGNRPLYSVWNIWSMITVPIRDYNDWGENCREGKYFAKLPSSFQELLDVPVLSWGRKGIYTVLFVAVAVVFALAFTALAQRNYQAGDLARKRMHRPFRKALEVVFVCAICSLCTGTLGGFYLQYGVESGYDKELGYDDTRQDIPDDAWKAYEHYGIQWISGTDFRERRSFWGEEIYYPGAFWKYNHYITSSSGFAREFAIDSLLWGAILALLNYGACYYGRRRRRAD